MDYSIQRRYNISYFRHSYVQKIFEFEKEMLEITLNFYSTTYNFQF